MFELSDCWPYDGIGLIAIDPIAVDKFSHFIVILIDNSFINIKQISSSQLCAAYKASLLHTQQGINNLNKDKAVLIDIYH